MVPKPLIKRCFSPFFLLYPGNCKKRTSSAWDYPKPGPHNLLDTQACPCSVSNSMRITILTTIRALQKILWGQMVVFEWWRKGEVFLQTGRLHREGCCLWWPACAGSTCASLNRLGFGSNLALWKGNPFLISAECTEGSQPWQSGTI